MDASNSVIFAVFILAPIAFLVAFAVYARPGYFGYEWVESASVKTGLRPTDKRSGRRRLTAHS